MVDPLALPYHLRAIWGPRDGAVPPSNQEEWDSIAQAARDLRLRPLLHERVRRHGWTPPQGYAAEWKDSAQRGAMRALRQRVELLRISRWLADAGISALVLKGGAIIWRGWFDPALRPMRDLDILVPVAEAPAAQALLISHGYIGALSHRTSQNKHLPGLTAPETGVMVEIHTRLIDAPSPRWAQRDEHFVALAFARQQRVVLDRITINVCADSDTLLHVIAHAALDHQFNNGPLLMLDVEMIVKRGQVDWTIFWATAKEVSMMRAAQLALRLVEIVMPDLPIDWLNNRPVDMDDSAVIAAANLMSLAENQRTELGIVGRLMRFSWSERPKILLGRFLLPRKENRTTGSSSDGTPHAIANAVGKAGRRHIRQSLDVAKWLRG